MKTFLPALAISALLFSGVSVADNNTPSVFVTHELNGESSITSVGVGMTFKSQHSNFGANVSMSLGNAEVVTSKLRVEDYLAWELGGKIGYFSDVSLYLEAGIDLGELMGRDHLDDDHDHYNSFDDDDYYDQDTHFDHYHDDYDHNYDYRTASDSLDAYIGIGGGIDFGHVQLNGHVRLRQIDSENWKALDNVYSGVTLSASF
jgi:hypothetical protein